MFKLTKLPANLAMGMPVLCALSVARAAAEALQAKCRTKSDIGQLADDLEVLKEVLAQVYVTDKYPEHAAMTAFCHRVLFSTRGLLLDWTVTGTILQELPVPKMPALPNNGIWKIIHPNKEMYLSEVTAGLNFLLAQQNTLQGQPWDWLFEFVHQLEYSLL